MDVARNDFCFCRDDGMAIVVLADTVRGNASLRKIDLSGNKVGAEGAARVAEVKYGGRGAEQNRTEQKTEQKTGQSIEQSTEQKTEQNTEQTA